MISRILLFAALLKLRKGNVFARIKYKIKIAQKKKNYSRNE